MGMGSSCWNPCLALHRLVVIRDMSLINKPYDGPSTSPFAAPVNTTYINQAKLPRWAFSAKRQRVSGHFPSFPIHSAPIAQ